MKILLEQTFQGLRQYVTLEMVGTSNIRIVTSDAEGKAMASIINFTELYQAINTIATENQTK